ncbi:8-oxoguanine glycosylase ogg1 [Physocladia obscura]|uniref:DNA-(apurinic or apyrimidinic site) lyase n=1 Tax=Physocladia obscura TaxID=109957 RepID=A0AAD5T194_9FUNG|nr:8-oxoguanine glycosylase ogg1 [Physocladia obscura]
MAKAACIQAIVTLKQAPDDKQVSFRIENLDSLLPQNNSQETFIANTQQVLSDYFLLNVDADALFETWNAADNNFLARTAGLKGIRLLRQDPVETLFAFICSANNNIARITGMVENLKKRYGRNLGRIESANDSDEFFEARIQDFYSFPSVEDLYCENDSVERTLRELGFGYRAGYIAKTARLLHEKEGGGENWLLALRFTPYNSAKESLLELMGVGPKVADCILLMALDKYDAVPVDTHVWRIATRDYGVTNGGKTLSAKTYKIVGDRFREIFGQYAGWAQSCLFSAEISVGGGGEVRPKKRKMIKLDSIDVKEKEFGEDEENSVLDGMEEKSKIVGKVKREDLVVEGKRTRKTRTVFGMGD